MVGTLHGMNQIPSDGSNFAASLALYVPVSYRDRSFLHEIREYGRRRRNLLVFGIDRAWIRSARRKTGRKAGWEAGAASTSGSAAAARTTGQEAATARSATAATAATR